MKLEEVEQIALQLDPHDQRRLADGIWRHLNVTPLSSESVDAWRECRLAAIARYDKFAGPDGDLVPEDDLRRIRD